MIVPSYTYELVFGIAISIDNTYVPRGIPFHDSTYPHIFVVQTESQDEKKQPRYILWGSSVSLRHDKDDNPILRNSIEKSFNSHEWLSFCCKYKVGNGSEHKLPQWQRMNIADADRLPYIQTCR